MVFTIISHYCNYETIILKKKTLSLWSWGHYCNYEVIILWLLITLIIPIYVSVLCEPFPCRLLSGWWYQGQSLSSVRLSCSGQSVQLIRSTETDDGSRTQLKDSYSSSRSTRKRNLHAAKKLYLSVILTIATALNPWLLIIN